MFKLLPLGLTANLRCSNPQDLVGIPSYANIPTKSELENLVRPIQPLAFSMSERIRGYERKCGGTPSCN